MHWRVSSEFSVLWRVRKHSFPNLRVLNRSSTPSASTSPSGPPKCQIKSSSSQLPKDDGDHDNNIDLITLRRRSTPQRVSSPPEASQESKRLQTTATKFDEFSENSVLAEEQAPKIPEFAYPQPRDVSIHPHPPEGNLARSTEPKEGLSSNAHKAMHNQSLQPETESLSPSLDPYLLHYLKSVESSRRKGGVKPTIVLENKTSRNDLDVESLRPIDVRTSYMPKKKGMTEDLKASSTSNDINTSSGEPAEIPEHIINGGVERLKLKSMGNTVIIPRSVLIRLIERTITLSGASISGENVIIERYSPTWHRFARLLRTSDLDKISSLGDTPPPTSTISSGGSNGTAEVEVESTDGKPHVTTSTDENFNTDEQPQPLQPDCRPISRFKTQKSFLTRGSSPFG